MDRSRPDPPISLDTILNSMCDHYTSDDVKGFLYGDYLKKLSPELDRAGEDRWIQDQTRNLHNSPELEKLGLLPPSPDTPGSNLHAVLEMMLVCCENSLTLYVI